MSLAADGDLQRSALVKEVALLVVGELHPDLPVAEPKREREFRPVARQPGREGQPTIEIAHAAEPEDQ